MDSSGSGQGALAESCEDGNEPSLSDYWLLKDLDFLRQSDRPSFTFINKLLGAECFL
jgi:hypothetical protein